MITKFDSSAALRCAKYHFKKYLESRPDLFCDLDASYCYPDIYKVVPTTHPILKFIKPFSHKYLCACEIDVKEDRFAIKLTGMRGEIEDIALELEERNRPMINSITCRLAKGSKKWVQDLAKYGLYPTKTGTEVLPFDHCSTEQEAAALLLGYHDADCSIGTYTNKRGDKEYKYGLFSYLGNPLICKQIQQVIEQYCGISPGKLTRDNRTPFIYYGTYSAKDKLKRIHNFLYQNEVLSDCWLSRKHARWCSCTGVQNYDIQKESFSYSN